MDEKKMETKEYEWRDIVCDMSFIITIVLVISILYYLLVIL